MSELEIFQFPDTGQQIRSVVLDGEVWFVARDVCAILGIGNASDALSRLDEDEYRQVAAALVSNEGRPQDRINLVNEPGVYGLVLGSRKTTDHTRKFKRWLKHDVLPQIRKTGRYEASASLRALPADYPEALEALAAEVRQRARLSATIAELKPAAQGYADLMDSEGLYSLATAAQALGRGRDKLIADLARLKLVIVRPGHSDHLRPYQAHVQAGRFVVKISTFDVEKDGVIETRSKGTTRITPKGLDFLRKQLGVPPVQLVLPSELAS